MKIDVLLYLALGVLYTVAVIRTTVRRGMLERESLLWLALSVPVLVLAMFPKLMDATAAWLGIYYPPSLVFVICLILLCYVGFRHAMQISTLSRQTRELAQRVALLEAAQQKMPNMQKEDDR